MQKTELTAHCSPEIADWLEPTGKLQEAGLMKADIIEDSQGSALSFRHKVILARDDNTLAAHQGAGNERKTGLFTEYQQEVMAI